MKRILSMLLVTILVVACLSTVAFAAPIQVETGDVETFTVTVNGVYCNFGVQVNPAAGLEIVSISGGNCDVVVNNGLVAWASSGNVDPANPKYFTVTVKVTATEPGIYTIAPYIVDSSKFVGEANDTDGVLDGLMAATEVSATSASYEIVDDVVIPCEHDWEVIDQKAATCTEDGFIKYKCSICGEEKTDTQAKLGHNINTAEWRYDENQHWHECGNGCGEKLDCAGHTLEGKVNNLGQTYNKCTVCGYETVPIGEIPDDVPPTGDITLFFYAGAVILLVAFGTTMLFVKRKGTR
ncbi:MAG: hypothetical protein E7444_04185 [Ruminococcaceae bacterium]|nr:hypothetical protein [Oscillospiraceae bacterium]